MSEHAAALASELALHVEDLADEAEKVQLCGNGSFGVLDTIEGDGPDSFYVTTEDGRMLKVTVEEVAK